MNRTMASSYRYNPRAMVQEHDELEMAGIRFQIGIFEEALQDNPSNTEALRFLAHAYTIAGRLEDGLRADRKLVELLPRDPRARYNLACSNALAGHKDAALTALQEAVRLGFDDLNLLKKDRDLDSLREEVGFQSIVEELARRRDD